MIAVPVRSRRTRFSRGYVTARLTWHGREGTVSVSFAITALRSVPAAICPTRLSLLRTLTEAIQFSRQSSICEGGLHVSLTAHVSLLPAAQVFGCQAPLGQPQEAASCHPECMGYASSRNRTCQ